MRGTCNQRDRHRTLKSLRLTECKFQKVMTSRTGQRSFPSPPKRPAKEPLKLKALTPEMIISDTDDDVRGDKVAQEVFKPKLLNHCICSCFFCCNDDFIASRPL